jgi:CheY-like chemotaxis protein
MTGNPRFRSWPGVALDTILLVEDSPTYSRLATIVLEANGYRVLSAATVEEALRLARGTPPRLILVDMTLPGMDGLQAGRLLKQDPCTREIPIVAMTADRISSETERESARHAGFETYVEKPISEAEFQALVASYLGPSPGNKSGNK